MKYRIIKQVKYSQTTYYIEYKKHWFSDWTKLYFNTLNINLTNKKYFNPLDVNISYLCDSIESAKFIINNINTKYRNTNISINEKYKNIDIYNCFINDYNNVIFKNILFFSKIGYDYFLDSKENLKNKINEYLSIPKIKDGCEVVEYINK